MTTLKPGVHDAMEEGGEPIAPTVMEHQAIVPMWKQRLRIFVGNKLAVASVLFILITAAACYLVPWLHPTNQTNQALTFGTVWNAAPSSHHWLGTDSSGFDELGRIFYGGEYSLTLGFLAGFITIVVGTLYGMISGFVAGFTDTVMMRTIDAFLSIPYLFLLITLITIFGRTTTFLILVIGLTGWWGNARIIRGDALLIRTPRVRPSGDRHGCEQVAHHSSPRLPQLDQQHRDRRHVLRRRRHPLPFCSRIPRTWYFGTADRLGHDAPGRRTAVGEWLLVGGLSAGDHLHLGDRVD